MAVDPVLISYAEVVVRATALAQGSTPVNIFTVYHYRRNYTSPPLSKQALATAFYAGIQSSVRAAINVSYKESYVSVRWIEDPTDAAQEFPYAGIGQVAGDRFPPTVSVYLMLQTALRGRSYRGSKHFSPISESDTTLGAADVLNGQAVANWSTVASGIATGIVDANANGWLPVVVSKKLSNCAVTPCVISGAAVTGVLLNKRLGTMRRRRVKSVY